MKLIISGTTGVGKSTTVDLLKQQLESDGYKVTIMGEMVVNNPFFDLYFKNLQEWGFLSQVSFVLDRFKQWLEIEKKYEKLLEKNSKVIIIFDRHFLDDLIFSELYWIGQNISSFNSNAYKQIYTLMLDKLLKTESIDFLFMLKASFETIESRMGKRGRSQEEKLNVKYWKDLYWKYYNSERYQIHFQKHTNRFITIQTDRQSPEEVVNSIIKYIKNRV